MLKKIINLLLPNQCILCQANSERSLSLCLDCEKELPWNDKACPRCGKGITSIDQSLCGICLSHPPPYHGCIAAFRYQAPISDWISGMKFHDKWHYSQILGKLFAKTLQRTLEKKDYPELIIPVPLHQKRLRKRGFNQALEIAKPIAKLLNIPIDIKSIQRIKNTQPQSELSAKDRCSNIRNAFKINTKIKASHIAIVDDVITTGNTINEFTNIVKKNGVQRIDVWACSRRQ